jgi:Gluconate 2-dehydrogenase subunit 3
MLPRRILDSSPSLSFTSDKVKKTLGASFRPGEEFMDAMERRVFLKGASMGVLAFTVDGIDILMTSGEARAGAVPFRMLNGEEAETLEALGEALVPGARDAGIAHFIDQQVSVPPGKALLEARIVNVRPPFVDFYRAAIGGVDKASMTRSSKRFAALSAYEQHDFIDQLRQNKIDGWQGPPAGLVYFVLRSDAVDVVYGTMDGYESLGVPYMPHIAPDKRW